MYGCGGSQTNTSDPWRSQFPSWLELAGPWDPRPRLGVQLVAEALEATWPRWYHQELILEADGPRASHSFASQRLRVTIEAALAPHYY